MKTIEIFGKNRFDTWTRERIACRGIVLYGEDVLLSYETETGQYMIPGGGLEAGESDRACCAREIAEETGVLVEPSDCLLEINEYYEEWRFVSRYFLCKPIGKTARKLTETEKAEGMEPRILPADEILRIFSEHETYAGTDEMRRGMYLREYTALTVILGKKG